MSAAHEFGTAYLETYFPKAFVITEEYFASMDVAEIGAALEEIVSLLGERAYFYFKNVPKEFVLGEYWENILEQCKIIGQFLSQARVDAQTGEVLLPTSALFFDAYSGRQTVPLLGQLSSKGIRAQYDFFALFFDFHIKMFNEGIRYCLLTQASGHLQEMERLIERLRGSSYEVAYQEALKRSGELMALLRWRLGAGEHD